MCVLEHICKFKVVFEVERFTGLMFFALFHRTYELRQDLVSISYSALCCLILIVQRETKLMYWVIVGDTELLLYPF
jgi:hypothetical protein